MGVLTEKLTARLNDLIARSEETDRQVAAAREACYEALAEMDRLARDLDDC